MNAFSYPVPIDALPARLADAGPFSLICLGEMMAHDPDLGSWAVQTSLLLGRFRDLGEAMVCAARRGRPGGLRAEFPSGFTPNLLMLQESRQRLCRAGQITPEGLVWSDPVASEPEARQVVQEAASLRARAMAVLDREEHDPARDLRFRAAALEARLVDPAWRAVRIGALHRGAA